MIETALRVDHKPSGEPGVKRLRFECPHGATSALVLPGRGSVDDVVALDILLARHHGTRRCTCVPAWPSGPHPVVIA